MTVRPCRLARLAAVILATAALALALAQGSTPTTTLAHVAGATVRGALHPAQRPAGPLNAADIVEQCTPSSCP